MIKAERIPTPLVEHAARLPPEARELSEVTPRVSTALLAFLGFFLRQLGRRLTGRRDPERGARELRDLMERLSGLWVKVGQLLSLRTDVLPRPYVEQLAQLQYRHVGFPSPVARATIEAELGRPIHEVFSEFDDVPVAAASVSQVHRAVLRRHGVEVAVKVQRPGVDKRFARDLKALKLMVRFFETLGMGRHMQLGDAVWELEQIAREEVDFRYEATNLKRLRKTLKAHGVYVPKPFMDHSTERVLVMEYVRGVLMSEYIEMLQRDPLAVRRWEAENDVDPEKVGERLFLTGMRQLMEDNLFHADLHPGNIMLLRNSKVALIDLGSVGTVDKEFLFFYGKAMEAMGTGDFTKAADYQMRLAVELPVLDVAELREKLVRCFRTWSARSQLEGVPYAEKNLAAAGQEAGRILFEYKVQLSWAFMKITRTWTTLDASLQYLVPTAGYSKLIRKYFVQRHARWNKPSRLLRDLVGGYHGVRGAIEEYQRVLGPAIRRQTLAFQGTTSKVARAFAVVSRALSWIVVLGTIGGIYVFLHQHHRQVVDDINDGEHAEAFLASVPAVPYILWIKVFLLVIIVMVMLRKTARVLDRTEYKT
jgi:ubiquinone biosynthesis protein